MTSKSEAADVRTARALNGFLFALVLGCRNKCDEGESCCSCSVSFDGELGAFPPRSISG
jgi:hypothetical protein